MNISAILNVVMIKPRGNYAIISMNVFSIMNVTTTQRCGIYVNISMDVSSIINGLMVQRRRCCSFDSPGLASDSEVYPGSFAVSGNNAVGVVPFIYCYFITTFHAENVQHLRR